MKKELLLVTIFVILLAISISNVSSADELNQTRSIKNITKNTDKYLEKPIEIPESIKPLVNTIEPILRLAFGLDQTAPLRLVIITLMLWVLIIFILVDAMISFSTFGKSTAIAVSICLTTIGGASGIFKTAATFLYNLADQIKFLESWSAGALTFWAVVIMLLWWALSKVMKTAKEYQLLRLARRRGFKRGVREVEATAQTKVVKEVGRVTFTGPDFD